MLEVKELDAGYGALRVLHDVDLRVNAGEVVAVVGSNGAGKTTLLRAINGIVSPTAGSVEIDGRNVTGKPTERMAGFGMTHVPENRLCFPSLTVRDNLDLGAWSRRGSRGDLEPVLELFPRLRPRLQQVCGTLSGGEQQMVAIGRGLMADPKVIILDEPSVGLAPKVVAEIMGVMTQLAERGLAVLLVEQNVRASFKIADRAVVMQRGRVVVEGLPAELIEMPEVRAAYLGGAAAA